MVSRVTASADEVGRALPLADHVQGVGAHDGVAGRVLLEDERRHRPVEGDLDASVGSRAPRPELGHRDDAFGRGERHLPCLACQSCISRISFSWEETMS